MRLLLQPVFIGFVLWLSKFHFITAWRTSLLFYQRLE